MDLKDCSALEARCIISAAVDAPQDPFENAERRLGFFKVARMIQERSGKGVRSLLRMRGTELSESSGGFLPVFVFGNSLKALSRILQVRREVSADPLQQR